MGWDPPPQHATHPDPIDPAAYAQLDLMDDETIARCWRTPHGFLVMTNLRCALLFRSHELFAPVEWRAGPSFFFYNLDQPAVVAGRFVELREREAENGGELRVQVHDPRTVCAEIDAARPDGWEAWQRRRQAAAARSAATPPGDRIPSGTVELVREIVKVRCRYCGNLMDAEAPRCPMCGAPQS